MTDTAHLDVLDRSVEKANIWINDVATELGTTDRHEAYRALRAFLHVLRDRLPVAETAQLSSQLPLLVRGVFYENWRPAGTPAQAVQVAPLSVEKTTPAPAGDQTTREPSAETATVPPAVMPDGSVPAGVQVAPPSVEIPKWMELPLGLPERTITPGASPA